MHGNTNPSRTEPPETVYLHYKIHWLGVYRMSASLPTKNIKKFTKTRRMSTIANICEQIVGISWKTRPKPILGFRSTTHDKKGQHTFKEWHPNRNEWSPILVLRHFLCRCQKNIVFFYYVSSGTRLTYPEHGMWYCYISI